MRNVWLPPMPELIGVVAFAIEAVGMQFETCTYDAWASPRRKREARLDNMAVTLQHGPISSLCTPFCCGRLRTVCCRTIPASVVKRRKAEDIIPSLIISKGLDLRTMVVLSVRLERFEASKVSDFALRG